MSEYTPPTEQVREGYASDPESVGWAAELRAEFDRWLAAHDAEVRAQALVVTDEMVQRLREAIFAQSQRAFHQGAPLPGASVYYPSIEVAETILRIALEAAFRENGSSDS